jgi:peptidyl-tRNA hydrolase, PTH1 family
VKLIVGLGNPGPEYSSTRHNIGFIAVDQLAELHNIPLCKRSFEAAYGIGFVCACKTIIAQPLTYMNRSGEAVAALAAYYNITPAHITVVHDDMDIPLGQLRIKIRGGSAGHRGITSVQQHLGEYDFTRIRIGIGKPPSMTSPVDYVLQDFTTCETASLQEVVRKAIECIAVLFTDGPQAAMNEFHRSGIETPEQVAPIVRPQ